MTWTALGALHKLSPQPVFCWEWGRIICHTVLWGGEENHNYVCSEQAAEHRAACYYWQLPSSLAAYVRAWLLKGNALKPGT